MNKKMKVCKVNSYEVFGDGNDGFIFGLEEFGDSVGYIEWFKSIGERDEAIKKNKFEVEDD